MTRRKTLCSLLLLAFAAGCPDGEGTPEKTETTTETTTTETTTESPAQTSPSGEADWTALLAALASTDAPSLPTAATPPDGGADSQLYEGESAPALTDPNGGADIVAGAIYTIKLATPGLGFTESWISFGDEGALLQPPNAGASQTLKLWYVDGGLAAGTLTPEKINALCGRPDAATLKTSDQTLRYFGFPSPASIGDLPNNNPPNTTTTISYEVFTSNMGQPPVRSGALYREIQTPPGGVPVWKDFWVFEHDYIFPGPGIEAHIQRVNTGGFTTLKAFLEAQQTLRSAETPANQAKWLYAPAAYSWRALCVTPPPSP